MELIFPDKAAPPSILVLEDDGLYFVDYIGSDLRKRRQLTTSVTTVVTTLIMSPDSAVREKGLWLAAYSDAVLGTALSLPKFRGRKIKPPAVA
jgi:hypothetical protein